MAEPSVELSAESSTDSSAHISRRKSADRSAEYYAELSIENNDGVSLYFIDNICIAFYRSPYRVFYRFLCRAICSPIENSQMAFWWILPKFLIGKRLIMCINVLFLQKYWKKWKKKYITRGSQAVTHPSTNHAQCCLTSVIERVCCTALGQSAVR